VAILIKDHTYGCMTKVEKNISENVKARQGMENSSIAGAAIRWTRRDRTKGRGKGRYE
jgi:hypothetical protein